MSPRRSDRGALLLEVAVYAAVLGGLALAFLAAFDAAARVERHALLDGASRAEADRLHEIVAADLAAASAATLEMPAPGERAQAVRFRRVIDVATDGATGVPYPVLEAEPVDFSFGPRGLVRRQGGQEVLISPRVVAFEVERPGGGRPLALGLRIGVDLGGPDGAAAVEGRVLVPND